MIKINFCQYSLEQLIKLYHLPANSQFQGYVIYDFKKRLFLTSCVNPCQTMLKQPSRAYLFKQIQQAINMLGQFKEQVFLSGLFKDHEHYNVVAIVDNLMARQLKGFA